MMHNAMAPLIAALLTLAGCAHVAKPSSADAAIYEVTFQSTWTKASLPLDYPEGSALNPASAHFSGLIGAPHGSAYSLFAAGGIASAGVVSVSHTGSKSPLNDELMAARSAGTAGAMFETGVFFDVDSPKSTTFEVSDTFPMVSFVTMIAPSPDWMTGVSAVSLKDENGKWVDQKTVDAMAWDSGAYEGSTYKVDEKPTAPRAAISLNKAPVFMKDGAAPPIAQVTFKRLQ
jgi:hypothetical protein